MMRATRFRPQRKPSRHSALRWIGDSTSRKRAAGRSPSRLSKRSRPSRGNRRFTRGSPTSPASTTGTSSDWSTQRKGKAHDQRPVQRPEKQRVRTRARLLRRRDRRQERLRPHAARLPAVDALLPRATHVSARLGREDRSGHAGAAPARRPAGHRRGRPRLEGLPAQVRHVALPRRGRPSPNPLKSSSRDRGFHPGPSHRPHDNQPRETSAGVRLPRPHAKPNSESPADKNADVLFWTGCAKLKSIFQPLMRINRT